MNLNVLIIFLFTLAVQTSFSAEPIKVVIGDKTYQCGEHESDNFRYWCRCLTNTSGTLKFHAYLYKIDVNTEDKENLGAIETFYSGVLSEDEADCEKFISNAGACNENKIGAN